MTEDDAIADPAMTQRRYRSFVARPPEVAPPAPAPQPVDDALPILTEIVEDVAPHPSAQVAVLLDTLHGGIADEVSAWLVETLPAAVAQASQQLLGELESKARNSLLPRLTGLLEAQRKHSADNER